MQQPEHSRAQPSLFKSAWDRSSFHLTLLAFGVGLLLAPGCRREDMSVNPATRTPAQMSSFFERGLKLCVMSEQGTDINAFQNQLQEVEVAWILISKSLPKERKYESGYLGFDVAISYWKGTLALWQFHQNFRDKQNSDNDEWNRLLRGVLHDLSGEMEATRHEEVLDFFNRENDFVKLNERLIALGMGNAAQKFRRNVDFHLEGAKSNSR